MRFVNFYIYSNGMNTLGCKKACETGLKKARFAPSANNSLQNSSARGDFLDENRLLGD